MSSFCCEKCGMVLIDTERGYITGCEHYPATIKADIMNIRSKKNKKSRKRGVNDRL